MQRDDSFKVVSQMRAPFRLPPGKAVLLQIVGVRQMVDAGQHIAEHLAVRRNAADRDAAETDAMITALAANKAGSGALTDGPLIGERHLQGCVDRFGTGISEHHLTVPLQHPGQPGGKLEGQRVADLKTGRIVELFNLLAHRLDN